jgi:3-hydroxyisobutyrate dehydrogenase-like beta-hydroxyacid dehydrogenase
MLERSLGRLATDELWSTGATVQGMADVQELVVQLAQELDVTTALFASARTQFSTAVEAGLAEFDPAVLVDLVPSGLFCSLHREIP